MHRKRTWFKDNRPSTIMKPGLHSKKVLLFILMGLISTTEFLSQSETINFEIYCNQLDKLKYAIAEKRPKLMNRRSHYNKTACCINYKRKAVTLWHFIASSVLSRSCSIRILFVLIIKKILSIINDSISEIKMHLKEYFINKPQQF